MHQIFKSLKKISETRLFCIQKERTTQHAQANKSFPTTIAKQSEEAVTFKSSQLYLPMWQSEKRTSLTVLTCYNYIGPRPGIERRENRSCIAPLLWNTRAKEVNESNGMPLVCRYICGERVTSVALSMEVDSWTSIYNSDNWFTAFTLIGRGLSTQSYKWSRVLLSLSLETHRTHRSLLCGVRVICRSGTGCCWTRSRSIAVMIKQLIMVC